MFTPILLTFASDDGATQEVADMLALTLREESLETELRPLAGITELSKYGSVIVGAPFSGMRWSAEARAFMVAHRDELTQLPVAVFATGAPVAGADGLVCHREGLLEELSRLRWLHPIAAEMFCADVPPANGTHAPGMNMDAVRRWARVVAHVLHPAAMR